MLDFANCLKKYNIQPKGLIQLGVHKWQEKEYFVNLGIKDFVLVEPQKTIYEEMKSKTNDVNAITFNCAVSDFEGIFEMKIDSNNDGQSGSLLDPKKHTEKYPGIPFGKREDVQVKKIKNLPFDRKRYNILYMDLQGNELKALHGADLKLFRHLDCIYTEVNFIEMYDDCVIIDELDAFLYIFGFKRVETGENYQNQGWSDAFYIKEERC
jgi:FkbM family methyltransferase